MSFEIQVADHHLTHFGAPHGDAPPNAHRGARGRAAREVKPDNEKDPGQECINQHSSEEIASKAMTDLLHELEDLGMTELEKQMKLVISFYDFIHILTAAAKAKYQQSDLDIISMLMSQVKSVMKAVVDGSIKEEVIPISVDVYGKPVVSQFDAPLVKNRLQSMFMEANTPNPRDELNKYKTDPSPN